MKRNLAIELMHDVWLMRSDTLQFYGSLGHDILLGKEISTGFFSSLSLPELPKNVALVVLNGPLAKSDVCEAEGSRTLTNKVNAAANDKSIDSIIILSENCPGGQVDGTQILADAIASANAIKPVYGAISGMACSAAVWALVNCTNIFATSSTDIFGCIGTMGRLKNPKAATENDYVEIVSDLSPDKNSEFKNPDLLKTAYLNPVTELFHDAVKTGRGDRLKTSKENVLSGKIYIAADAIKYGLIDGLMSMEEIITMASASNPTQSPQKKYTMAFENSMKAAGATEFAVVEGGFLLEETHLNALEAALATAKTNSSLVTSLQAELATATATATTAEASLATANTTIATLQAKVAELGKVDGARFSQAKSEGDKGEHVEAVNEFETEIDKQAKALAALNA